VLTALKIHANSRASLLITVFFFSIPIRAGRRSPSRGRRRRFERSAASLRTIVESEDEENPATQALESEPSVVAEIELVSAPYEGTARASLDLAEGIKSK